MSSIEPVIVEAPDEAGHMGRADLKREAIERIDELIIGPLLRELPTLGDFRLLLMPDHATPCKLKTQRSGNCGKSAQRQ